MLLAATLLGNPTVPSGELGTPRFSVIGHPGRISLPVIYYWRIGRNVSILEKISLCRLVASEENGGMPRSSQPLVDRAVFNRVSYNCDAILQIQRRSSLSQFSAELLNEALKQRRPEVAFGHRQPGSSGAVRRVVNLVNSANVSRTQCLTTGPIGSNAFGSSFHMTAVQSVLRLWDRSGIDSERIHLAQRWPPHFWIRRFSYGS